jgi:hypothetical protein
MYYNCFKDYYGKKVKNSDGHKLKKISDNSHGENFGYTR